jgi:hypothetical protein
MRSIGTTGDTETAELVMDDFFLYCLILSIDIIHLGPGFQEINLIYYRNNLEQKL